MRDSVTQERRDSRHDPIGFSEHVVPSEAKGLPSKALSPVLFRPVTLKGLGVRVVRPTIEFDQEPIVGIREVGPTYEPPAVFEDFVLRRWQLDASVE
jgi:hypothetical protein